MTTRDEIAVRLQAALSDVLIRPRDWVMGQTIKLQLLIGVILYLAPEFDNNHKQTRRWCLWTDMSIGARIWFDSFEYAISGTIEYVNRLIQFQQDLLQNGKLF